MKATSLGRTTWIFAWFVTAALATHINECGTYAADPSVAEELRLMKEETVSIAARHEQPISEAPANVYVITDEDIRQSGATDIPTILRRIPGIEVMQMSGAEFNVSVRGDNQPSANKLLVLVDGRSIYEDAEGTVFWKAIPVTLPEIKRIEVLKGPASAVYGFNAFDGVVNIITKSPEEMKGTTLQFGGGELGTITAAAIQAGVIDKFGYRLSVGRDQTNQWRNREALGFRSNKFNVNTEYGLPGESKLLLSGGLVDVNRFDGPIVEATSGSSRLTQGYANLNYVQQHFSIRSWWNRFDVDDLSNFNPQLNPFLHVTYQGSPISHLLVDSYSVESQYSSELFRNHHVTFGADFRYNKISGNSFDTAAHENRLGLYLQEEWRISDSTLLSGGIRSDFDTNIHPTFSPRIALLYSPAHDHTLHATISVAYRPPTLFERHFVAQTDITLPPPIPSPPSQLVTGNTTLAPEQIISYELGYQGWFVKHRIRLRADLFFNHLSDLINHRNISPTMNTTFNDPGSADIYGGEAGIEFLATRWLTSFANYAYEEIGQNFTDTTTRGVPRFKWNIGLRGEWENGLSGEAALHHVGAATYPITSAFFSFAPFGVVAPDIRVGSYNLLNLRAGYRFWHEKAEVAVSAFNALNDRHKEHPLGDTIGSRVMGWVTIRF